MSTVNAKQPSGGDAAASEMTSLSKDDIFHVLQNGRRRRVLQYLADTDGSIDMREVAEQVAAWEHDTTIQQLTSDQRQRVYIALYQSHLPKLADFGLITYNQSRGIVEQTPLADQATRYLEDPEDDKEQSGVAVEWIRYYAGATVTSILLISAVWLDIVSFIGLSSFGLAVIITLLYTVMTAAMAIDTE